MMEGFSREREAAPRKGKAVDRTAPRSRKGPRASQARRLQSGRSARFWELGHEEAKAQEGKVGLFDIKRGKRIGPIITRTKALKTTKDVPADS